MVPARQMVLVINMELGITGSGIYQSFQIPNDYVDGTMSLDIGGDEYLLVDNFAFFWPTR